MKRSKKLKFRSVKDQYQILIIYIPYVYGLKQDLKQ
jgi:hypothetical protein